MQSKINMAASKHVAGLIVNGARKELDANPCVVATEAPLKVHIPNRGTPHAVTMNIPRQVNKHHNFMETCNSNYNS
jgi:hypothetical protein